ncbi:hypothetical protein [Paracoccus sp. T5]|uniref:hypothetical protein n=1 Tax=Paracoccus sp. T5 TaxID=3402161 RepID=UPI003AECCF8B
MTAKTSEKLVALVARGLKGRTAEEAAGLLEQLPAQVPADPPARRRVLLAMRIALLRQSQGARPVLVPPPAPPEPVETPEPAVVIAPPPAPKRPPKTVITSIRLEDAAQLLAAASEPEPVPPLPAKPVREAAPEPEEAATPAEIASTFVADADFWNSDFDAPWPEANPSTVADEPAPEPPHEEPEPRDLPPMPDEAEAPVEVRKPRKRKKAGAAPAPMDAADAAAAMNALFMMGDDDGAEGSGTP